MDEIHASLPPGLTHHELLVSSEIIPYQGNLVKGKELFLPSETQEENYSPIIPYVNELMKVFSDHSLLFLCDCCGLNRFPPDTKLLVRHAISKIQNLDFRCVSHQLGYMNVLRRIQRDWEGLDEQHQQMFVVAKCLSGRSFCYPLETGSAFMILDHSDVFLHQAVTRRIVPKGLEKLFGMCGAQRASSEITTTCVSSVDGLQHRRPLQWTSCTIQAHRLLHARRKGLWDTLSSSMSVSTERAFYAFLSNIRVYEYDSKTRSYETRLGHVVVSNADQYCCMWEEGAQAPVIYIPHSLADGCCPRGSEEFIARHGKLDDDQLARCVADAICRYASLGIEGVWEKVSHVLTQHRLLYYRRFPTTQIRLNLDAAAVKIQRLLRRLHRKQSASRYLTRLQLRITYCDLMPKFLRWKQITMRQRFFRSFVSLFIPMLMIQQVRDLFGIWQAYLLDHRTCQRLSRCIGCIVTAQSRLELTTVRKRFECWRLHSKSVNLVDISSKDCTGRCSSVLAQEEEDSADSKNVESKGSGDEDDCSRAQP